MKEVNHKELENSIRQNRLINKPMFVKGGIGIGKSQTMKKTAKDIAGDMEDREFQEWNELYHEEKQEVMEAPENYFVFVDFRTSQIDPTDLKGIPDVPEGKPVSKWNPPQWVHAISDPDASGMVFFDEINHATIAVQHAAYQIINDHQIGDIPISDDVYIAAAGNRAGEDEVNVQDMEGPLRDRFAIAELQKPTGGKNGNWTEWAYENGIASEVISYIGTEVGLSNLYTFDRGKEIFATPRAWEDVSRLIKKKGIKQIGKDNENDISNVIAQLVGNGVATEFIEFLRIREQMDLEDMARNPEKILELDERDKVVSVASGVAEKYADGQISAEQLVDVAITFDKNNDPTSGILMLKNAKMLKGEKEFKKEIVGVDSFSKLSGEILKYMS